MDTELISRESESVHLLFRAREIIAHAQENRMTYIKMDPRIPSIEFFNVPGEDHRALTDTGLENRLAKFLESTGLGVKFGDLGTIKFQVTREAQNFARLYIDLEKSEKLTSGPRKLLKFLLNNIGKEFTNNEVADMTDIRLPLRSNSWGRIAAFLEYGDYGFKLVYQLQVWDPESKKYNSKIKLIRKSL